VKETFCIKKTNKRFKDGTRGKNRNEKKKNLKKNVQRRKKCCYL
jgi:hypothetical protein